jgi:5-phospho-D-xylono-1,4-lactonase
MTIHTVTGPIDLVPIRLADAHNHLWIERVPDAAPASPALTDFDLVLRELRVFAEIAGGPCVQFDCQPGGFGRNARRLRALSEQSGVAVVCCTGYHLKKYATSHWLWTAGAQRAADYFVRELTVGVEESPEGMPIRAGFIKIAFEQVPTATPPALVEAVGAAVGATGCAVEVHTDRGDAAERILPLLESHGIPAGRVVLCHMDKRKDLGLHRELIAAGALLEYDTFTRTRKYPAPYPFFVSVVDSGLWHGVALATDMATAAQWSEHGGGALSCIVDGSSLPAMRPEPHAALLSGNIVRRMAWAR